MLTITPAQVDITDLITNGTESSLDAAATLWLVGNNEVVDSIDDTPAAQKRFEDSMVVMPSDEIESLVAAGKTRCRH